MVYRFALLTALFAAASWAQTFNCTLSSPNPRAIRIESVADRVGDLVIQCTGGSPPTGGPAPTGTVAITLPLPVTSRILGSNNFGTLIEALLMIDDPAPGNQFPCELLSCPFTIGQPLGTGSGQNRNVYQGILTNANTVTFSGIPIVQPGSGTRTFRVVNIRTAGSTSLSPSVPAAVSLLNSAGASLPLSPSSVTVASILPPVTILQTNTSGGPTGIPPVYSASIPQNPFVSDTTTASFLLRYAENSNIRSFFRRNPATSVANPSANSADNVPSTYGSVETGFYVPTFTAVNLLNEAGLAKQGTRLEARFTGIPAGVNIWVGTNATTAGSIAAVPAVRLINPATGAIIAPTTVIQDGTPVVQLPNASGAATAVWEVFADPQIDGDARLNFPVVVSYSVASPGTVQVGLSLGPVDTGSIAASATLPVPRFLTPPPNTAFTITSASGTPPSITTTSLPNGQQGLSYGSVVLGVNGGQSPYTWSIFSGALPNGVTLSPAGSLSGTPTVNGTFNFVVRVTDSLTQTANASLSILVRPPVSVTTFNIPDGQVGVPYATTNLGATGGLSPYTWSLFAGALPNGLTLSSAGAVSGTPTVSGSFNFTARVTDSAGQTADVILVPVIRPRVSISTTSLPNGSVGVSYTANIVGSGGSLPYSFALTTGSLPGGLSLAANGAITGTPNGSGTFVFDVRVTDGIGQIANASLSITIGTAPVITTSTLPSGQVNIVYAATNLTASGGTAPLLWSILSGALPAGVNLSSGGVLTGTPTASGTFNFRVEVKDNANAAGTADLSIVIRPAVSITTTTLPGGAVGLSYSANVAATGGSLPYTFALTTGSLPAGLTLAASGAITGIPTGSGTFSFDVRVTDGIGQTANAPLSITVGSGLTITTTSLPNGQVNLAYPATNLTATGGNPPFVWSVLSGALPGGLTLSSTGTLTGTPTASGTFNFTVQVKENANFTATASLSIVVRPAVSISTTSVPDGQVNIAYASTTLSATGGLAPYAWTLANGALPGGLTLSQTGVLSGTPTGSGAFNFTARVTDAAGQTSNAPFSFTIRPAVSISTTSLPNGTIAVAYSANVAGSGGLLPYAFALSNGALPPGLSLAANGAITGTPTGSGSFSFVVRVTDGVSQTATSNLNIFIGSLTITTTSLPGGQVGLTYPATTLTSAGGIGPFVWSITSGALPSGLTLSGAGVITGIPNAVGSFSFKVRVAEESQNATADFTIVVTSPLGITVTSLPTGFVGVAYLTSTLTATGGTAPYTWSIATGALPAGLSLSSAGAITGTPTGAGFFNFVARVTDNAQRTATAIFALTVETQFTIATTSLPSGQVGVIYGPAIIQYTGGGLGQSAILVTSGSLPTGLTLSPSGSIGGTPTAAGTFPFIVTLSNVNQSTTANLSIVIASTLQNTSSLPEAQVGIPYTAALTQSGGAAPFTWAVTQGTLPAGLSLSTAGAITGTPTTGGIATFTTTVTDVRGQTSSVSLQIATRNRVRISTQILPDAQQNTAYAAALTAAGGLAPFRWSLGSATTTAAFSLAAANEGSGNRDAGLTLPAGLILDPAGFITGTPTSSGNFDFTLTVRDALGQTASGDVQLIVRSSSGNFTIPTFSLPTAAVECRFSTPLQVNGGTPPYTWSAIGLPQGLSISPSGQITGQPQSDGSFLATFIVTDSAGQSTRQQLRFNVAPVLSIVSPESIAPVGADQAIPIAFAASGGTPPYTFSIDGPALPQGLSLDGQGLVTGRTSVTGTFSLAVKVIDSCGASASRSYPVRVLPSRLADCSIAPQPESLKFTIQQGTGAVSKSIGLAARCATPLAVNVQAESAASWLSASPGSASASAQVLNGITVTANPGSLPVGTYTGSVSIGGAASASVPVVMTVVSAPVILQVSPVGLTFTAVQNGPNPAPQNLNVVALPRGPLSWSAASSTVTGGQWFTTSVGAGSTGNGVPGVSSLSVQVSPAGLAAGEYYGTIEVTANGAANPSKSVTIVLNVLPADRPNTPTSDPTGLIMTGSSPRIIPITNPSRATLSYTTSRHPIEGRVFFAVDPPSGTVNPGARFELRLTPDPASITEPGVRRALLVVRFSDGSSNNIEVVQVVPRISATPASADGKENQSAARALAGCTATRLVGVFTTLQQNFSIPVGWPAGVDMEIVDDCTEPHNSGSATIGFSCCDSPKAMIPLGRGRWSTTWTARAPQNTEVAVTGDFTNDARSVKGTHSVTGVIARTGNPPVIAPGGAVSGATFGLGQPLAPGILTSVFGLALADATTVSQSLPLSTTLGSTSASLGGKLLPLFFTSDGQLNTQAPFDLPVNTELSLIVRRGGALSTPETVTIAPSAPGMFTSNQRGTGQAAVVDVQGRLIAPGNAAPSGGVAILFATGLGAVDQPVQAGFQAPGAEPLARTTLPVSLTVGGVPAQVLYGGLAPGFVGLYQINFLIPSGVTPGDAVPLVVSNGGAGSNPGTIAIR